jgi:hypothetical protein
MKTDFKRPLLSKSTFIRGSKCLKSLYLYKHHYDLRDKVSESQQAIFDQGHEVGMLARKLFPEGTNCTVDPAYNYSESVTKTNEAINSGAKTIYEAGFVYNGVYAAADILVIKKDGWYLYEVKSSSEVKDYHLLDAAIQLYILKGLNYPVRAVHIVHINTAYVRKGEIKPAQLFSIVDVTEEANAFQATIAAQLPVMFNLINSNTVPNMKIGKQCSQFYDCDFRGHCWKHVDEMEFPVYNISRIGEKLWTLLDDEVYCQTQINDEFKLTVNQRTQVICNQNKSAMEPDLDGLEDFMKQISYPISFFDFETFSTAIPLHDDSQPYHQVPFQYSLHILHEDGRLEHKEFLGDGKTDPREKLLQQLLNDLPPKGSIICYYMSFEKQRLQELAALYPQYATQLGFIIGRIVDLIIPFRSKYIYDYRMDGSASIKDVLPALIPELSYDKLAISEGGSASRAYLDLYAMNDDSAKAQFRNDLLEYCKLDTFAMVELYRHIDRLVPRNAVPG